MTDHFKEKAASYDSEDWDRELSAIGEMLLAEIPFHKQMHVMDFGAGTGLICGQIAPVVQRVTAVDISQTMLDRLTAKPELKKVQTVCQDILVTPIDEKFDLIISGFALHHIEDTGKALQSFAEHLSTGACLALVDMDEEDGSFHAEDNTGVYHNGFNRNELEKLLQIHAFENIQFVGTHFFNWQDKEYSAFLVTAQKV
jgi:SAM-dependent methyltransferase